MEAVSGSAGLVNATDKARGGDGWRAPIFNGFKEDTNVNKGDVILVAPWVFVMAQMALLLITSYS